MIVYRKMVAEDLCDSTLAYFCHNQIWHRQWVKKENRWVLEEHDGSRCWDAEKRVWVSGYIKEQLQRGGRAVAAFDGEQLVAFACVDGKLQGDSVRYANLAMIFVDDRYQKRGIGKKLMNTVKKDAIEMGADILFVSAIPSEETVAFYLSIGCRDAERIIPEFVDAEKDRLLELCLQENPPLHI